MISVSNRFEKSDWIAIDGCKSGWISCQIIEKEIVLSFVSSLHDYKSSEFEKIYIDIPVTLPLSINDYPRASDIKAKKLLGKYHSSIFYAPVLSWLELPYQDINSLCEKHSKQKISIQSFNLFSKIKEAVQFNNVSNNILKEVHPELLFHYYINHNKKSKKLIEGQYQRLEVISSLINRQISFNIISKAIKDLKQLFPSCICSIDDIIDALFLGCLIEKKHFFHFTDKSDIMINDELSIRFNLFKLS